MRKFESAEALTEWMNRMDIVRTVPVMRYNDGLRATLFGTEAGEWYAATLEYEHQGPADWFFTGYWQVTVNADSGPWILVSHEEKERAYNAARLWAPWFGEVAISPRWDTVE